MDRKANPRLYDEIQDTENLSVVSSFSYNRAIFWLFENVQHSYHLPVAVSFSNNGLVWAFIVVGRAFLFFFFFFFISGGRGIGMANNTKAYFFLSFLVISFIFTRVIKQENSYSEVDFFKFKPIFFFGDVVIMWDMSFKPCFLLLLLWFLYSIFFSFSLFRNIHLNFFFSSKWKLIFGYICDV